MTKSIITFLCSLGIVWNSLSSMHWEQWVSQIPKQLEKTALNWLKKSLFIEHEINKIQTTFTLRLTRIALAAEKHGEEREEGTLEECIHKEWPAAILKGKAALCHLSEGAHSSS